MKSPLIFLLSVLSVLVLSCGPRDGRRDIKEYYYPALDLQEGIVYRYDMTVNGATVPDYWYLRTFARDSGVFLSSTNYDRDFHINQMVREKIVGNGSVAQSYLVFEQDSASGKAIQTVAQLESPDLFPFSVKDSTGVFLFSIHYRPPSDPGVKLYLIRNRRYLGDAPDFEFQGKKYPCIRMGVREVIGNEAEGSSEIEGSGEEWYAKGLGLVYFEKKYGAKQQIVRQYRLMERFPMSELEKRAGSQFQLQD